MAAKEILEMLNVVPPFTLSSPARAPQSPRPDTPDSPPAPAPADTATIAASPAPAAPRRSKAKIALAVALTLSGVGILTALIPPPAAPPPAQMSTLQKHVAYFDRNGDNQVTLGETYRGLRDLELGVTRSAVSALVINGALGLKTSSVWWSPTTIDINNIHLGKHGSDTGIIDAEGRFVQAKYDEMWQKWDPKGQGFITEDGINAMRAANKNDKAGAFGSKAEFDLLLDLASEKRTVDGREVRVITRDTMQDLYDGSLFYKLAGRQAP